MAIMIQKLCWTLALLWALASSPPVAALNDWDQWQLDPVYGIYKGNDYPLISNATSVKFAYNYTGTLTNVKTLTSTLYQADCLTPAGGSVSFTSDRDDTASFYFATLDIKATQVVDTPLFVDINSTFAQVQMCLRVDYNYRDESVHFHETFLTLTVDLTADFSLVAISTERIGAAEVNADVQCRVISYFCDPTTLNELVPDPVFQPGSTLSVCVEAAPDLSNILYLDDIWDTDLDSLSHHDDIIVDFTTDDLTDKTCRNGVCHIRSFLSTKWFDDTRLNITGVALCAVGEETLEKYLYPELDIDGGFLEDYQTERQLQDLQWDLARLEAFPAIDLGNAENEDIQFRYYYSGTLSDSKTMSVTLFQKDCVTPADFTALSFSIVDTAKPIFGFNVDVNETEIVTSSHYVDVDATTARIHLCARVDYNYVVGVVAESQNFHETNVTITVDLTNGFALNNVNVGNLNSDVISSDVYCSVVAYFCHDDNSPLPSYRIFQGENVQFCVEYDSNGPFDLHVVEMIESDLDNPNAVHSDIITNYVPDALTEKTCEYGVCQVNSQMTSKWFTMESPPNVTVTGYAICAVGPAPTPPVRQRALSTAMSPARRARQKRRLQPQALSAPFANEVVLDTDDNSPTLGVVMGIVLVLLCCLGACCGGAGVYYRRKRQQDEEEPPKKVTQEPPDLNSHPKAQMSRSCLLAIIYEQ